MVRKPRLCVFGQLTREAYRGKIVQLRAAVSAGDLTEAQLDRYDAELFACLELPACDIPLQGFAELWGRQSPA
jgi:hypothetical protein